MEEIAFAELQADFKPLCHSQAKTIDDRLDQLSYQFSSLYQEVSGILHPQHHSCVAADHTTQHTPCKQPGDVYL